MTHGRIKDGHLPVFLNPDHFSDQFMSYGPYGTSRNVADALGSGCRSEPPSTPSFYIKNVLKPFGRDVAKRKKKSRVQETKLLPICAGMGPVPKVSKALIRQMFGNRWTDDWPANSPDLNLIENIWAIVDSRIRKRELYTLESMRRRVTAE